MTGIENAVKGTANNVLGPAKANKNNPWFDKECVQIFEERRKANIDKQKHPSESTINEYIQVRDEKVAAFYRNKKRKHKENEVRKIQTSSSESNIRETYNTKV